MMIYLLKGKSKEIRNVQSIVIQNGRVIFTLRDKKKLKYPCEKNRFEQ